MVTTTGVVKIIIKHPCTAIPEGDFDIRRPSQYLGILFLIYNTVAPLRKATVNHLITNLKIKPPDLFFHDNSTLHL
ncbi:MAG: hypothetical protein IMF10_02315 [Proteobacteria bacterium]|nr:hypothetical protein [Pseudomonadota bacterium]